MWKRVVFGFVCVDTNARYGEDIPGEGTVKRCDVAEIKQNKTPLGLARGIYPKKLTILPSAKISAFVILLKDFYAFNLFIRTR